MRSTSLTLLLLVAAAATAHAETPKRKPATAPAAPVSRPLGSVDAWTAYSYTENGGRVCYLVGDPARSEPVGFRRHLATAMVTHRPEENVTNVISFTEGYALKPGSEANLDVGDKKFDLFTNGDTAWSRTADLDRTIVDTMIKGRDAVLTASPPKGPRTIDSYSLAGFGKALALIDKACGVKR
jgi:hypothetical protein